MSDIGITDERISKAADLLEQIKAVDEMLLLHRKKEDENDIMVLQYERRRDSFLKELILTLQELNIRLSDFAA